MDWSKKKADRAVVITGVSSGIGAACALALDRDGFRVFAGVRSEADGLRLQQQASGRLRPMILDVTDRASIQTAAQSVGHAVEAAGLAGLVNNAGIAIVGPLEILPIEELRRQFEVNVIGQIAVTQAMLPLLRAGRGRVVNMGSLNGVVAPPYFGPYAATKFAMEALTDSLRVELRKWEIAVSLIEPGSVKTPIWEKSQGKAEQLAVDVSAESYSLYQEDIAALRLAAQRLESTAMPVERVVAAVRHALCASRPKTRYPVGIESRLARAARLLPDRFRDRILMRGLGLS